MIAFSVVKKIVVVLTLGVMPTALLAARVDTVAIRQRGDAAYGFSGGYHSG